ncbi:hypothetical protein E4U42_006539 [Claviceps africana]|uniref:superoxide dismutase n=1 Tax=Claviceps africana TaxID=83212 RepID=A0A8K0J491_9HYPO|nr:hypothetical protein E4U42_006539 [Claviceps africana]
MRTSARLLAFLAAVNTCYAANDAPIITGNPVDVIYTASLPSKPFFAAPGLSGSIQGFISASAPPDGVGVRFTIRFENLPKTGGPFPYHLHIQKATGGNCTAAGAHLDPTNRGEKPPCDAGNLPSCQAGDLSGKYGRINSDPFTAEYVDKFLSLKEDDPAFFGNRSFVIHLANTTRVACADFVRGGSNSTSKGDKSACVSGALAGGCPSPSRSASPSSDHSLASPTTMSPSSSSNHSLVSPTTVLAAAGKTTPLSLAWWTCAIGLLVAFLG